MVGFVIAVLILLAPVFKLWGTAWWIDAIAIGVVGLALGAFALGAGVVKCAAIGSVVVMPATQSLPCQKPYRHDRREEYWNLYPFRSHQLQSASWTEQRAVDNGICSGGDEFGRQPVTIRRRAHS
jgi:hypothetical protein